MTRRSRAVAWLGASAAGLWGEGPRVDLYWDGHSLLQVICPRSTFVWAGVSTWLTINWLLGLQRAGSLCPS